MIRAFPKIFAIGTDYIKDIFQEEVEVSEKVDGSQFDFGKLDGEFYMRSKGKQIFPEAPDKMFQEAVDYALSVEDKIPDNIVYYAEYFRVPQHNVVKYDRTPENHLMLFGIGDGKDKFESRYEILKEHAEKLGIEPIPLLFQGKIESEEALMQFLKRKSALGEVEVEGIVVKNYHRPFLLGGQPIPVMMGKYVSEKFKETHRTAWGRDFTAKGRWETFKESFCTEARWQKAIQHLRESGEIESSPRDIGKLIKEVQRDIEEEEKENIKNFLWSEFGKEAVRFATRGFPEWYKEQLVKNAFKD